MTRKLLVLLMTAGLAGTVACSEDEPKKGEAASKKGVDKTSDKTGPVAKPKINHKKFDIDRVDDSRYVIDDEAVTQLLLDGVAGQIHVSKVNRGYRLDGYADDTLITKLGLDKGDVVVTINDAVLTDPHAARVAFAKARGDGSFRMAIDRKGVSIQRRYYLRRLLPGQSMRYYRRRYRRRRSLKKADYSLEKVLLAMRSGVKRLSDTHIQVDREIWRAFEDNAKLLRDGLDYVGLDKGYAVKDEYTVYKELKLTKYDVITKINGITADSRSGIRRSLSNQANAKELTISVDRLGEPMTIRYQIVDNVVNKTALTEALEKWKADKDSTYDPFSSRYRGRRRPPLTSPKTTALISSIRKIDDTTYEVSRTEFKGLWTGMYTTGGARIVPSIKNGKQDGFKLYAIRPSSVWKKLGFKNGDKIHTINALILDSMTKMMDIPKVFTPTLPSVAIVISRRGRTVTLNYRLK